MRGAVFLADLGIVLTRSSIFCPRSYCSASCNAIFNSPNSFRRVLAIGFSMMVTVEERSVAPLFAQGCLDVLGFMRKKSIYS